MLERSETLEGQRNRGEVSGRRWVKQTLGNGLVVSFKWGYDERGGRGSIRGVGFNGAISGRSIP